MVNPEFEDLNLVFNKLDIYGLFGMYDYENITFRTNDGVLILYGLNGMGKTTILTLIHQFKEGEFEAIANIYFKKILILFDVPSTNTKTTKKFKAEIEKISENQVNFRFYLKDNDEPTLTFDLEKRRSTILRHLNEFDTKIKIYDDYSQKKLFEELRRRRNQLAHSGSKVEFYRYVNLMKELEYLERKQLDSFSWFQNFGKFKRSRKKLEEKRELLRKIKNAFKCHYISAQRLDLSSIKDKEEIKDIKSVIELKSKNLISKIQENLKEYTKISQTQDKDLVERIINSIDLSKEFSNKEIKEKLTELEKIQEAYKSAGLDTSEVSKKIDLLSALEKSGNWGKEKSQILYRILNEVIISDGEKKLSVFENLFHRIALFQDIINNHLSKNKKFEVNHIKGFRVENISYNEEIDIELLSSGEKHLIVLFYELIFDTQPYTLVMIDEPEISLHVDWQVKFIKNLLKIRNSDVKDLNNIQFILATHSPQIVHNRGDLAHELKMEK